MLTAINQYGWATAWVTVTAGPPPIITSFQANPFRTAPGQTTTLSWAMTGSTSLAIIPTVSTAGSSATVKPAVTTSYLLTATNSFGTATAATLVTVGNPPTITGFAATPPKMSVGQSSTLNWVTTGSPALSITPGVGTVSGTSATVTPPVTTTYTLTATNLFGTATAATPVSVGAPPTIASFAATPASVTMGQSSTLKWVTTGSSAVNISPGIGNVTGSSVSVKPSATTTYTLTATNSYGSATTTVTIPVGNPPTIAGFTATPATVLAGQPSTLNWAVTGAPTLSIDQGVGAVTGTSATVTPSTTTTYTLTATNAFGSATAAATVTAGTAPTISRFIATPANVTAGQSSTLNWAATGAQTLSIGPALGTVTGTSAGVTPAATTTYTLTATNAFGTATAVVTVTVGSPPTVTSFTATPATVTPGQSSTLNWVATGAPTLTISPGLGIVTGTSAIVTPAATTTYTLTATNAFGSATGTVTVPVGNPPAITSFLATPASVTAGQPSALSWVGTGAPTLTITPTLGVVTNGPATVRPAITTSYTLTATNTYGTATAIATVTVGSPPTITSFTATPVSVAAGQSSTLNWVVTGSPTLRVNAGVGAVAGTSATVTPATTTTFTLTATNAFGTATAVVTVTVGNPPTITSFTATPASVTAGQSSTLSWVAPGAVTLSISPGLGIVTGTSVSVRPAATTTYTLTATNAFGSPTATATVTIAAPSAPTITSFVATPATITGSQTSTLSWMVTGSPTLSISPGVGAVTGTSVGVRPLATTLYTLTATNSLGSVTATTTVMIAVAGQPIVSSFTATPASVTPGQSSTLNWAVSGSPTLSIDHGVGIVTGTSVTVQPAATTAYTLTATNSFGTTTAIIVVTVGNPPIITGFTATPASVTAGQSSTLSWTATGAPTLSISGGIGVVTGTSVSVKPAATTTYTLTAINSFGSITATATVTVTAAPPANPPAIVYFSASPATLNVGQSTALSWNVNGATSLAINCGVGAVTGNLILVQPSATTTYTLTATNAAGFATATAKVTVNTPALPTIGSFRASPDTAGQGTTSMLVWTTTGAANLSIDQGVGAVAGTTATVAPTATTTYTLTATNALGSVTATATVFYIPLVAATASLYYTEHVMFIIPPPAQVDWTAADTWDLVYSTPNVDSYVATLNGMFPSDYFFVVVAANQLTPNNVPNVQPLRRSADGIGLGSTGVGIPSICRYHLGGGTVIAPAFGVLDHEIGHNWGVFLQPEMSDGNGHWYSNSTALGQMAVTYSDDGGVTDKLILGDMVNGFTWTAIDNIQLNETETFSGQDLYLQGLASTFPDTYVLTAATYNSDHTVTYDSATKYDDSYMTQTYGARNPSYRNSPKRQRMGVVYIARDLAEIQAAYQPIEHSIDNFVNGELIDTTNFRFQVPFLVDTQYRATVDALLADLDGNSTPVLTIPGSTSLVSSGGSAIVPFTASDPDGPAPWVSCVPLSATCSIVNANVVLSGLPPGTNFITIKAQDAGGKRAFAHFVVDVQ